MVNNVIFKLCKEKYFSIVPIYEYCFYSFFYASEAAAEEVLSKKDVLKNFAKFPERNLCRGLFSQKIAGLTCNFIKKDSNTGAFLSIFVNFSRTPFFTEHLSMTFLTLINKNFLFIMFFFNLTFFTSLKENFNLFYEI